MNLECVAISSSVCELVIPKCAKKTWLKHELLTFKTAIIGSSLHSFLPKMDIRLNTS